MLPLPSPMVIEGLCIDQVLKMYELCGFDADASVRMLTMLTNMETKLEEYLSALSSIPTEYVESVEKAREKDRRQQAREEKIESQQREHEARVKRALERASAPVFKKSGKPVMFRCISTRSSHQCVSQG